MNKQEVIVTVVIPVYKVKETIEKCINSVLKASCNNIEIVLVDDGSPDECPNICDKYCKEYSNVQCIHKENGGLSSARNAGIRVANGKYIMFLDSDDYVDIDGFRSIVKVAKENYCDIITYDALKHVSNTTIIMKHRSKDGVIVSGEKYILKEAHEGIVYPAWISLYKLSFIRDNSFEFWEGMLHEDIDFCFRVFLRADSILYTKIIVYHYIIREHSITTGINKNRNVDDTIKIFRKYKTILKSENWRVRNAVMDSLVGSVFSIIGECGITSVKQHDIQWKELFVNSHTIKNKVKSLLFMIDKSTYIRIRSRLKH